MTTPEPASWKYLDDLQPGQSFETRRHTIDADQIFDFARQFDPQPFHLDEEAAIDGPFGGLAASGWHSAALMMRLMVQDVPIAGGIVGAGGDLSWKKPVRPGDTLRVIATVTDVRASRSRPDRGIVSVRCETFNQHDHLVQLFDAKIIVPKRS